MNEYFGFNGFKTYYDENIVRFEKPDSHVEFSLEDPDTVLSSSKVGVQEIEDLGYFLMDNLDIIKARIKGEWVEVDDPDEYFTTPGWLNEPVINLSQVCLMLYGKKDKSTTAYFAMKRQGKRPWKPDELKALEQIRKVLAQKFAHHDQAVD
jgi:hypothetical protein